MCLMGIIPKDNSLLDWWWTEKDDPWFRLEVVMVAFDCVNYL